MLQNQLVKNEDGAALTMIREIRTIAFNQDKQGFYVVRHILTHLFKVCIWRSTVNQVFQAIFRNPVNVF